MAPPRPSTLPLRVAHQVRTHGLIHPNERVAVAVSGGCDSTVLLDVLVATAGAHQGRLEVISFDHGLRPESAQEVRMVATQAADLGLPFQAVALEIEPGPALAERARAARLRVLDALDVDRVATGHHREDQSETVLQRLTRGAGARGLASLQMRRGRYIRPLLEEDPATLRAYATERGLRWVEDPSNPASERGHLRMWLDGLEQIRPGARRGLARSARLLARDEALLQDLALAAHARCVRGGDLDLQRVRAEPRALSGRVVLRWLEDAGVAPTAERVDQLLDGREAPRGRVELGGGWTAVLTDGIARLQPPG